MQNLWDPPLPPNFHHHRYKMHIIHKRAPKTIKPDADCKCIRSFNDQNRLARSSIWCCITRATKCIDGYNFQRKGLWLECKPIGCVCAGRIPWPTPCMQRHPVGANWREFKGTRTHSHAERQHRRRVDGVAKAIPFLAYTYKHSEDVYRYAVPACNMQQKYRFQ